MEAAKELPMATAFDPGATASEPSPFRLRDGRPVWFGPVTPDARDVIVRVLARLSPESSRRRFFTVRYQLSEAELDALTILDGFDRYAVGATVRSADGAVEGVGCARYVRMAGNPEVAEVAFLVVDAYQGQGVGKALLVRLAAAAVERGIHRFEGIVLPDNTPVLGLLTKHAPGTVTERQYDYLRVDVDLRRRAVRSPAQSGGPFSSTTLPSGSWM
jgi:GNAT superfamily N-acetyltransferase